MAKYKVEVEWSGYSRGNAVYIVEAPSAEYAKDNYYEGEMVEHEVVRDDTEGQDAYAELYVENKKKEK